jgi:hypothetical protein
MKTLAAILILSFITVEIFAQNTTEIDTKSLRLPRYNNTAAISSAISSPLSGMMVFNSATASIWAFNGISWVNTQANGNWLNLGNDIYNANIGNVGIGMNQPLDKLEINGRVAIMHNYGLEFGKYVSGKETNAGKIGYALFTANTLDIVGAGTAPNNRKLRFWAEGGSIFEGPADFYGNISPRSISIVNNLPLNTGVNSTIGFGGSNYTTGLIQTVGINSSNARMGFFTGYSFTGGVSNLLERFTIGNNGNVGIGTTDPQAKLDVNGATKITGLNGTKLFSISNTQTELLGVSPNGVNISTSPNFLSKAGTVLVNSDKLTQLGKWGFDNQGAEMTKSADQSIPHGTETKVNFDGVVFEHSNYSSGNEFGQSIANVGTDEFLAESDGIYLIDFELHWFEATLPIGGSGLRNGKVMIKVNGGTRREFEMGTYIRDRCYIKCENEPQISIWVYHEHCVDPPPLCITGINRILQSARVTVVKL